MQKSQCKQNNMETYKHERMNVKKLQSKQVICKHRNTNKAYTEVTMQTK